MAIVSHKPWTIINGVYLVDITVGTFVLSMQISQPFTLEAGRARVAGGGG